MYEPVDTTSTWPVELDDEELDEVELDEVELVFEDVAPPAAEPVDVPPVPEFDPVELLVDDAPVPVTCWPTVSETDPTVPAMVDVRVASERSV
jgi:hypothetical protein